MTQLETICRFFPSPPQAASEQRYCRKIGDWIQSRRSVPACRACLPVLRALSTCDRFGILVVFVARPANRSVPSHSARHSATRSAPQLVFSPPAVVGRRLFASRIPPLDTRSLALLLSSSSLSSRGDRLLQRHLLSVLSLTKRAATCGLRPWLSACPLQGDEGGDGRANGCREHSVRQIDCPDRSQEPTFACSQASSGELGPHEEAHPRPRSRCTSWGPMRRRIPPEEPQFGRRLDRHGASERQDRADAWDCIPNFATIPAQKIF